MVAIGLLLFAAALGAGAALFMQNRGASAAQVHVFGHTLTLQPYSIMAAGAAIAVVALLGIAVMRRGAARARRLRVQRDRSESAFFFETFAGGQVRSRTAPGRAAGAITGLCPRYREPLAARLFHPLQFGFVELARVPQIEERCNVFG